MNELLSYLSSLLPNRNQSTELWIKVGLSTNYLVQYSSDPTQAVIRRLKSAPSEIDGNYESFLDDPITWEDIDKVCRDNDFFIKGDGTRRIQGDGLHHYVNQFNGLPLNKNVTCSDTILIELDTGTIEEQKELLARFESTVCGKFFCKIFSGGKSIHAHLKLDGYYEWKYIEPLAKLLMLGFVSDGNLAVANHTARLPGAYRFDKGTTQDLLEHSQYRFGYAELKSAAENWFLAQHGYEAPKTIEDDWFSAYKRSKEPEKFVQKGQDAWLREKREEEEKRRKDVAALQAKWRKDYGATHQTFFGKVCDAVNQAIKNADGIFEANIPSRGRFLANRSSRNETNRCKCIFHGGDNKTIAWTFTGKDGNTHYTCVKCTTESKAINALEFDYALTYGLNIDRLPRNYWEWLQIDESFLKDFCRRNGVEFPDRPQKKEPVSKSKSVSTLKAVQQEAPAPEPVADPSNVKPFRGKGVDKWAASMLRKALQELSEKNLTGVELQTELLEVSKNSGYTSHEVKKLYEKLIEDQDNEDDRLRYMVAERGEFSIMPPVLATEIEEFADRLKAPYYVLDTIMLSVCSSLIPNIRLELEHGRDYNPMLWCVGVGESGEAKTPQVNKIVQYLRQKDMEAKKAYESERKAIKAQLEEWDSRRRRKDCDPGAKPKYPAPALQYIFDNFTTESIAHQLMANSREGRGLAIVNDELSALVGRWNKYNNGTDDRANFIKLYDGGGLSPHRVKDYTEGAEIIFVENPIVSFLSMVQDSVMQSLLKAASNSETDGLWARFLWFQLPLTNRSGSDRPGTRRPTELAETAYGIQNKLQTQIGNRVVRLSDEAIDLWCDWRDEMEDRRASDNETSLTRMIFPKAQDHALKIALNIHCINIVSGCTNDWQFVDAYTMQNSIDMARRSVATFLGMLEEYQHGNTTVVVAKKVLNAKRGQTIEWITVKSLSRASRDGKMMDKAACMKVLEHLTSHGFAEWIDQKKGVVKVL